jgi:hypothetical protein
MLGKFLTTALFWCALMFLYMLIQALAFRWSVSLTIEVLEWWRQVLNNLAGAIWG